MSMNINFRIVNDKGSWIKSRPWHVESNIGNGWTRLAVCETLADAQSHIELSRAPSFEEDALGLGLLNN